MGGHRFMLTYLNVYVFISGDRTTFGLTILSNGINLPDATLIGGWQRYDVVPMSLNSRRIAVARNFPHL